MAIKNRILEIRLKNGYKSEKNFAGYLEINSQQYSRYECNKKTTKLRDIKI
ncbi:transcriptional regulator [Clostridium botulinum]|uniref:transcriptional regulator n=1 Tax=Clostridium cagae TaxID=2080751 RepID=UPI000173F063|nr:transcriptional regulator [Clostridium botulinum]NFJ42042.1 transcriptional regulator [Clostridium botulinum B str. Eklund 17B (NRP)]MBY7000632.1 transcriptional regulator [Clostridium botulinum]MCR1273394.1 transcriptional regulator [Clostridium botulinum]NFD70488.1 transcriptional regulator [Clostridium botulinum]